MSRKYVLSILLFLLVMPVCLLYGISDSLSQAVTKLPADSNHSLLRRTYCERIIADTVNASFKEKVVAYDSLMTWSLAGGDSVAYYKYLFGKGRTLKEQGNIHASYNNYKRLAYELSMKKELVPELEQIKRKAFMEMPGFLLRLNRIDESLDFSYNLLKTYPDMSLNEKIKIYSSIAGGYINVDQKLCLTYINKIKAIVDSVGGQHLSMKDDRIMSGMIQGMKKNDALKSMRDGLRRLKHTDDVKEKNAICSELDAILKSCEIYDDMNEEVRLQFEVAHPHFTENLRNACPQLTDREVYICTLLASGMSAKEIARVSSYTIRSVETIIYRLRKKLQLPTEVKTQDYLQQFC